MNKGTFEIFNQTAESIPFGKEELVYVIELIQERESRNFYRVEVVFVDDNEILEINSRYLGHDYVTDIITFPYHDDNAPVEGTLFCCITQIKRQSQELNTRFKTEVLRVVIHGLLHLVGHVDTTDFQRDQMHALENKYIKFFQDS